MIDLIWHFLLKNEHPCGLQRRLEGRLLIRRSLVRAQVEEPDKQEKARYQYDSGLFFWRAMLPPLGRPYGLDDIQRRLIPSGYRLT